MRPGSRKGAWSASEVIVSREPSGEIIALYVPSGTYLRLDESAALIVSLLDETSDQILTASKFAGLSGISLETAHRDVDAVVAAIRGSRAQKVDRGRRPTMSGLVANVQLWLRLPWRFRRATLRVFCVVIAVEIGLRLFAIDRLAAIIGVPLVVDDTDSPPIDRDDVSVLSPAEQTSYWAVSWVMDRWLFDGTCLRRALTFGWIVRRRHPILRLGMLDKEGTIAHAWIEVEGHAFNAQPLSGVFVAGGLADGNVDVADD